MKAFRTSKVCAVLLSLLLLPIETGHAEQPNNPFGNMRPNPNIPLRPNTLPPGMQKPPSQDPDFQEDDDLGGGQNYGFKNPNVNVPPSNEGAQGESAPPPLTPPNQQPGGFPMGRASAPMGAPTGGYAGSRSAGQGTSSQGNSSKSAPKLADYLELDSAVKGLEVKNFDLPDKDIRDVVTLISKWTGKNFILDSKVRGKITIIGPSQVTLQEAYQAFLSALDANGLTTTQEGKFIRIIESTDARRSPVRTYSGDYAPRDDQFITRIFQLKYINSDEVQREFRDMTSRSGKLFAYQPTNTIIITDTGANIQRIKDILETLDVKGFETTLHVLHIKHGAAKAIADMLDNIYGNKSGTGSPAQNYNRFQPNQLERTRGGGIITKIIPDEATNSLIVMANQAGFDSLQSLVNRLDIKVTDTGRIHVYYCEYAKAADLASTLASLAGGGGGSTSRKSGSSTNSPFGGGGSNSPFGNSNQRGGFGSNSPFGSSNSSSSSGSSGPVTAQLGEGVKVTSDDATNSLVITANAADYQTLKRVIQKLDIPRLQVFVETAILEVVVGDSRNLGNNMAIGIPGRGFGGGYIGDGTTLQSMLQPGGLPPDGTTIPLFAGPAIQVPVNVGTPQAGQVPLNQTITISTFMAFLHFLTQNTNSQLLSTPQIIALDNEQATFKVTDKTPVASSISSLGLGGAAGGIGGSTGGFGFPAANVDQLTTGIQIELTPHVNAASKTVRLEIKQEVDTFGNSNNVPQALQQYQKATTQRETDTTVVVKDHDFVMLGGMLRDQVTDSTNKIPLLGDIPILGWLFKSNTHTVDKTNLIILLHPRIIGTSISAAQIVQENLDKRGAFIDKNFDGEDSYKEEVSGLRGQLKDQVDRGQNDIPFNYRNNDDEKDDDAKVPPGEQSQIDDGANKGDKTTKLVTQPAQPQPAPVNNAAPSNAPANGNSNGPLLPQDNGDSSFNLPPEGG